MSEPDRDPPLETIRLTIELTRESDTPKQWTSSCLELDVISGGATPEHALEAVAEAVRMMVDWEIKDHGARTPSEAFAALAERVKR